MAHLAIRENQITAWQKHTIAWQEHTMFDYSLKKLFNFNEHPPQSNALTVVVTIKEWDKDRDESQFMEWLKVGARQVSDDLYTIKKIW
jgi:hypothetical protein